MPRFNCITDAGLFFRSAINRREKNYWLPGLNGGIPLSPKKDPIHEIIFAAHDIGHMCIPDLIVSGSLTDHEKKVYIAYRMMSEAITLVFADMFFVDTLVRNGLEYDFTKGRIYPLFKELGLSLDALNLLENSKKILHANVRYCLRGDDSEYASLISSNSGNQQSLGEFKDRYVPFFVEDFRWTAQNIERMSEQAGSFDTLA